MSEKTTKHETLAGALAAFQAELPTVEKGSTAKVQTKSGPGYSFEYADLSDVSARVLPLLGRHGLAWTTRPTLRDGVFVLVYELRHEGGETVDGLYPLPPSSTPAQQMGGAITYARRYTLCAVTGVAPGGDEHAPEPVSEPEPPADWRAMVAAVASSDQARTLWAQASTGGWLTDEVQASLTERVAALKADES